MEENKNEYYLAVENAKDIQSIKDAMVFQNVINKSARTSRIMLGLAGMVLTGVVWMVSNVVADLEKRVNAIEGVEKKTVED